eukprot:GFUD01023101.1.p1 GENE.GFUD01023101.1~~GFUD01023101.1.p1  ORF type:complete len:256 (-),score=56.09 GFUD01023101.1:111-878(-)
MLRGCFYLFFYFLIWPTLSYRDPGIDMMDCLDKGEELDACAKQTVENFRETMDTGVPELQLPVLDPLHLKLIVFKFYNLTTELFDVDFFGFKKFILKSSNVDKKNRTWVIKLSIPTLNSVGMYRMFGTIWNFDFGQSTGDESFSADSVDVTAKLSIAPKGNNVEVTDLQLSIEMEHINLELECLFPRNGACCPEKYLKSCNSVLTKTVLRFINQDGKNFIKEFQPEISKKMGVVLKDYFNKAIASAESRYLIDYA